MSAQPLLDLDDAIDYPDSDGQPMADNTLQWEWIATIKNNLELLFVERDDVFVAGDLLWYPVKGRPDIRRAPDALVAFGRPKGYRGSYIQHREEGVAPQVVFEIRSPKNSNAEMARKLQFYDEYGVEEYYLYDPDHNRLNGWRREELTLVPIRPMADWVSPRLGIRFVPGPDTLTILRPDGERFVTFVEQAVAAERAQRRAERVQRQTERAQRQAERAQRQAERAQRRAEQQAAAAEQQAAAAEQQAAAAEQQAAAAEQRAERLAARLRALGIDPEA
jgi:Uma2 family endonuclease